jgi:hypothetical protein
MSTSVGKLVRSLAADGYFGKADLATAAKDMLDGRGITKTERSSFKKAVDAVLADPDVYVPKTAARAYEHIMDSTARFSPSKDVHGATFTGEKLKGILALYTAKTRTYSGGEYAVSSSLAGREPTHDARAPRRASPAPARPVSGGEG